MHFDLGSCSILKLETKFWDDEKCKGNLGPKMGSIEFYCTKRYFPDALIFLG